MRFLLVVFGLLLTGCVPPFSNGVFYADGELVHWSPSDFPLEIVVDEQLPPQRQQALQEAIQTWNDAVGATVFTITDVVDVLSLEAPLAPGLLVVVETDLPDYLAANPGEIVKGYTRLYWNREARMQHAWIAIDVAAEEEDATVIFVHELGHALGLSHDTNHMSVMYRSAMMSWRRIEEDDRAFVRWEMQRGY